MTKFIKNYWKTILATLMICYLCFAPPKTFSASPTLFNNADKLVHFFMFFFLAIVIFIDYQHNKLGNSHRQCWSELQYTEENKIQNDNDILKNRLTALLFCWVFPVLFGLFIEGVQHFFLSFRQGDLKDWLFDCIGYINGFLLAKICFKSKQK